MTPFNGGQIERYVTLVPFSGTAVLRHDGENGPQQLHFFMEIDGSFRHLRVNSVLRTGVFHHVAGTYDGSVMRLFLDGIEIDDLSVSGTVTTGSGVRFSSSDESLDGLLDEIKIYNRALSLSEIQELASIPEPIPGDLDGNGKVDFSDFLQLSANFGNKVDPFGSGADVNGNGKVDFADFLQLSANFGASSNAVIPEPSTSLLAAIGVLGLLGARRPPGRVEHYSNLEKEVDAQADVIWDIASHIWEFAELGMPAQTPGLLRVVGTSQAF